MRAAIYNGKRDISLTELPTPTAGDNDIVIKKYLFEYMRNRRGCIYSRA